MYIRSCLVVLGIALATLSFPIKRDATTVENDFKNIDQQTKSLGTAIAAFPNTGGTLEEVLVIAGTAIGLDNVVKSAIGDASASAAFTEAEGGDMVELWETLAADTQETLSELVGKQAALAHLPVSGADGIVLQELRSLKSDSDAFFAAVSVNLPTTNLVGSAQKQVTRIDDAFNNAISTYS